SDHRPAPHVPEVDGPPAAGGQVFAVGAEGDDADLHRVGFRDGFQELALQGRFPPGRLGHGHEGKREQGGLHGAILGLGTCYVGQASSLSWRSTVWKPVPRIGYLFNTSSRFISWFDSIVHAASVGGSSAASGCDSPTAISCRASLGCDL